MRTIEIIVAPDAKISVKTKGFQGSSCREGSRLIEQALGKSVGETLTSEFYQAETFQQSQQHRSG